MSSKKRRTTILSLVLSTAAWGSLPQQLAQAQTVNGDFHGTVIDSTGAVVPGATVEVTNLATGLTRNASANQAGFYTITQLPPGQYSVTASKTGFAKVLQSRVELLVNQDVEADYTLNVGAVTQHAEGTSAPPALEPANATLDQALGTTPEVEPPLHRR